jgi:ribosomal protein S18 acetylase RimI-like enzyme
MLAAGFGEELVGPISHDPSERPLLVELAGTVVGTLRVDVDKAAGAAIGKGAGAAIGKGAGAATAGIYGFAVDPTRRGQGIGREVLRQVCTGLFDEGCSEVHLEVEVVNERALGLYTSIGFEQRATEDYYALDTQNRTPS